MPIILQIIDGLKIYGLLLAIQNNPDIWKPIFVQERMPVITPTTLLDEVEVMKRCCCRPTTSTCDLRITLPLHLDTFEKMSEILLSALKESGGFHLL